MLRLMKRLVIILLPLALSVLTVMKHSLILFVLLIFLHFLILKLIPEMKHRENIGMFVMVAFSSIPINFEIFRVLANMGLFEDSYFFMNILRGTLYYIVLLSVEEVIMGLFTRFLWKKQYYFLSELKEGNY